MTFSRLVDQAAAFFGSKADADFEKALSQVIISVQAERVQYMQKLTETKHMF
jgi:hypothetical protein